MHAGGLRYHGDAPMVCGLVRAGRIEPRAYRQNETFEAAVRFARSEGIIPAPEPAHAIRAVIEEASDGEEKTILFGLCGHGHFDLAAYDAFLAGKLEDPEFSEADLEAALAGAAGGARDRLTPRRRGWCGTPRPRSAHSYASATSTFVRAARRAGSTAASTPATTATTANAISEPAGTANVRPSSANAEVTTAASAEAERHAADRPDQRRDDALVADHPAHLAAASCRPRAACRAPASARTSPARAC